MSDTPKKPSSATIAITAALSFFAGAGTATLRSEMKTAAVYSGEHGAKVVAIPPPSHPPVLLKQELTTAAKYGRGH